jgi:hypothetical protein
MNRMLVFTELLDEELEKRGLRIPWKAHDPIAELQRGADFGQTKNLCDLPGDNVALRDLPSVTKR